MTERWAIITGASRGLGQVLAVNYWAAGYSLHLIARDLEALTRFQQTLSSSTTQQCLIHAVDLSCDQQIELFCSKVISEQWPVHALVNNAAIHGPIGPASRADFGLWKQTFQVDLFAAVALCQAVVPAMIRNNYGSIINISGGGATGPRPNFSAYACAKTALVRFSETLAQELRPHKIRVNCIAPGPMPTKLLEEIIDNASYLSPKEFELARSTLHAPDHTMHEAAQLALYLSDPQTPYISGKIISALWDDWRNWCDKVPLIDQSDIYTLRRIVGKDRAMAWGDKE